MTRDQQTYQAVCRATTAAALIVAIASHAGSAQQPATLPQQTPLPATPDTTFAVTVVATTPLPGVEVPANVIPAPVQVGTAREIEASGSLDLSDFFSRRMTGVHVNEIQGNPFQSDLTYRGYTASPLLGTPQGLSIYMDGVRLNQPFGEVVSWDLIPRIAISTTTLMPGSNPLFGLNTLGGAVSIQTKTGLDRRGTTIQATYGSDLRRALDVEHGGHTAASTFHWYVAGSLFGEDGWRDDSPSDVRQVFGKVGWRRARRDIGITVAHANNSLTGNGLQDVQFLDREYASIYTKPDTTDNRSTLLNLTSRFRLDARTTVETDGYYRDLRTRTLNGDINEEALDQSLYQPGAVERAALVAAGYGNVPSSGLDATNTPFPSLRCIANVLLQDEPAEKCNGLINRTHTDQRNGGASAQLTRRTAIGTRENVFTVGGGFDRSGVGFGQSTELGYLNPDRSVTGLNAFGDGVTGGDTDGEPFDTRVDLDSSVTTWSLFAAETLPVGARAHVTLSGRYNRTAIENRDRILPGGGEGSLDGDHRFGRFNPAVGVTLDWLRSMNVYAGYSEGSRAPTSIELGCADPENPCRLPNAMAGDPPLEQVVTRTFETGLRGTRGRVVWNAGFFHAQNRDDILFVTSEQTGFGYFRNFGETRRRGLELGAHSRLGALTLSAGYTLLDATFQSAETVNGESNSTNDAALDGVPGVEGAIEIDPSDRMPLVPRHLFKASADAELTSRLGVAVNLIASSGVYARGNENNQHQSDGLYYLGAGSTDAYAIVNVGARYRATKWLQVVGQVNNLFARQYATSAQLGPTGFTANGNFIARPFPAVDGAFPVRQTTFLAPGAPLRVWIGMRARF
jgi:outer membrane receptor protein involved in Fe transport